MRNSRVPGLFRRTVRERIDELQERGWVSADDATALRDGHFALATQAADKMIENVIGTFSLPFAIAPNFIVNGREHIVPLAVEEPSIVAALSNAARLSRSAGGFVCDCDESLSIGQVHLTDINDVQAAGAEIMAAKSELLKELDAANPSLLARGGGAREIQVRPIAINGRDHAIAVHLLIDTCDAMGANIVNSLCETIAPRLASLCGGKVAMRILSNLADRSLVTARVRYRLEDLSASNDAAMQARNAIVVANDIALADPYRAATHNKGIMNGIDALAIATGNDWRAIEAGAHAFAAASGRYRALTKWSAAENGDLVGELCLPLKLAVVGGTLEANPAVAAGLRICDVNSARELAHLMAAVGLAQNFAAIRALAGPGIQAGHMRLHARNVAAAAGASDDALEEVATELAATGEVNERMARQLVEQKRRADEKQLADGSRASGKVILLGEHAVVYGKHALAFPIEDAVLAVVEQTVETTLLLADWGIHKTLELSRSELSGIDGLIALITDELGVPAKGFSLRIRSSLPRAMGLGSSAAIAVAVVRAFAKTFDLDLDNERVNSIAFMCETLAHGTPSGVDNTIATYGMPMLFHRGQELETSVLDLSSRPPLLVAHSNTRGLTAEQVSSVRARREQNKNHYDAIFSEINALTLHGSDALIRTDYDELGACMNMCHGLLNAIEVSTPELERMVSVARAHGAAGAKLTGAGGGGSIVALCPGAMPAVSNALRTAGFNTRVVSEG